MFNKHDIFSYYLGYLLTFYIMKQIQETKTE